MMHRIPQEQPRAYRLHGSALAARRDRIRNLWLDGKTVAQIAEDIGIEPRRVFGHLKVLREEGQIGEYRLQWANQLHNAIRLAYRLTPAEMKVARLLASKEIASDLQEGAERQPQRPEEEDAGRTGCRGDGASARAGGHRTASALDAGRGPGRQCEGRWDDHRPRARQTSAIRAGEAR